MSTNGDGQVEARKCDYCDFTYENTKSGRARYMIHVKRDHPDQTKAARAARAANEQIEEMNPLTQRFYEAISRVVNKPSLITGMVKLFQRYSSQLGANRVKFRDWAKRYGLTGDQVALIEDEMFGPEGLEESAAPGQPGQPGQTIAYVPQPGGGYQPIIINPYQQPQVPQAPGQPPTVIMPPGYGAPPQGDSETREAMRGLTDKVDRLVETLTATLSRPPEPQPIPMRRVPMLDDEGNLLKDASGHPLYQEIPYDPAMSQIEIFRTAIDLTRPKGEPPKQIDEETLLIKIKDAVRQDQPKEPGISAELQRMFDDLKADSQQLGAKFSQLERESEVEKAVKEAVAPLVTQLQEVQRSSTMSDSQFTLTHRERMAGIWQGFLGQLVGGVREDMRPMIVQNAVSAMQQLGVPNEIIQGAVSSFNVPTKVGGALKTAIDAARDKWVK
ncbi:MAG: hypothetical protein ABIH46_11645 [Chloroflexota bacterium]